MTDSDVERIEARKAAHADTERMRRRWERDVPRPRGHLEHVAGEGDATVLEGFYARERGPERSLAVWLASWDMHEISAALRKRRHADAAQQATTTGDYQYLAWLRTRDAAAGTSS
jgi:hypothetical protein